MAKPFLQPGPEQPPIPRGDPMAQGPRMLSKADPALQFPGKQFPCCAAGVAAPLQPSCSALGTGDRSAPPETPDARASPGFGLHAAPAAGGRCAGPGLLCCQRSALSSSFEALPSPAATAPARGRGPTARRHRRASWHPGTFLHPGRAAQRTGSERPNEEGDPKMPLSTPLEGDSGASVPSRSPKKHTPFHIWRPKKKQQLQPSPCGVFVPHPPQAPLAEAR